MGWSELPDHLHIADLGSPHAEFFVCSTHGLSRRGPDRLAVVRFLGPIEAVPHHFQADGHLAPLTIDGWSEKLIEAPVILNAGLFDADQAHLGTLVAHGHTLASRPKTQWKGFLIGDAPAHLVDLDATGPMSPDSARHQLHSMMLLDASGATRCDRSSRAASRTVLAQDNEGRLLIIVTEGAVVLADLSRWLKESSLNIACAINLDGGFESQLALRTPHFSATLKGHYGNHLTGHFKRRLPAVLTFDDSKLNRE